MWVLLRSVGGSRYAEAFGFRIDKNETPLFRIYVANFEKRTAIVGQFGWGGTLLKQYQQCPMVGSSWSEISCRVQGQKPA